MTEKSQQLSATASPGITLGSVASLGLLLASTLVGLVGAIVITLVNLVMELRPRKYKRHSIQGQVALVTGGGSGIGRLLCVRLAQQGVHVVTWDVNEAGNKETCRQLEELGHKCTEATVDLCDKTAIYAAADRLKAAGFKVDILVNNAGIVTGRNFLESPDSLVERTFAVNVLSHFWTVKAFLPAMVESNRGHIVTVASMAGKIGVNKLIDYCSSKFAAVGFDESLRTELMVNENTGVFTTMVAPYYINTGMFEGVKSKLIPILEPEYVADEMLDAILMRQKELVLPCYSNVFVLLKLLLHLDGQKMLFYLTGTDECLENFNHLARKTPSG